MKKIALYLVISIFVTGLAVWVNAQESQDTGLETITFEKGKMPPVTFPHRLHQQKLNNDCSACHDLFPMKAGIIKEMITQEKLKNQQVMNTKCLQCHKERKSAGLATGPIKCTECHVRPQ